MRLLSGLPAITSMNLRHRVHPAPHRTGTVEEMSGPQISLLITLTGRDRPGVTSRLFTALAAHELTRRRRRAGRHPRQARARRPADRRGRTDLTAIHREVAAIAADLGLEAEITMGSGSSPGAAAGCT